MDRRPYFIEHVSSTSKGRHGESRGVRSTATRCQRQWPRPTAPNRPSPLNTAVLDWRPQCVDRIVDNNRGADDHVRSRLGKEGHRAHRSSSDLSTGARPETRWGNDALLAQDLHKPAACTHSPSATTTMRSLRSLPIIPEPTISVRPTLAPLYQFYPDTSLPAVPLLSRHSHRWCGSSSATIALRVSARTVS